MLLRIFNLFAELLNILSSLCILNDFRPWPYHIDHISSVCILRIMSIHGNWGTFFANRRGWLSIQTCNSLLSGVSRSLSFSTLTSSSAFHGLISSHFVVRLISVIIIAISGGSMIFIWIKVLFARYHAFKSVHCSKRSTTFEGNHIYSWF